MDSLVPGDLHNNWPKRTEATATESGQRKRRSLFTRFGKMLRRSLSQVASHRLVAVNENWDDNTVTCSSVYCIYNII